MNTFSTKRKKKASWRDAIDVADEEDGGGGDSSGSGKRSKFAEWHARMDGVYTQRSSEEEAAAAAATAAAAKSRRSPSPAPQPNPWVFLEVGIGDSYPQRPLGRLEIELFADVVPRTAENFKQLCQGGAMSQFTGNGNLPLCFAHNSFHRIITGFMAQGGDITREDGTGGESIYGRKFDDENFLLQHSCPGILSMANSGRHANNSQFFLTFVATPHLNGRHVVFGQVRGREGLEILKTIEEVASSKDGEPRTKVTITGCGVISRNRSEPHPKARGTADTISNTDTLSGTDRDRGQGRKKTNADRSQDDSKPQQSRYRDRDRDRGRDRDRDKDRGRDRGTHRDRDRDRQSERHRNRDSGRDRDRDRDSDSFSFRGSLSDVRSQARARLKECTDRVKSLETEVKESSWTASGTVALASSGGIIEQIEVELTEILVLCERAIGRDGIEQAGKEQDFEQGLTMAKRQVRELGDRLAKVKEQCV